LRAPPKPHSRWNPTRSSEGASAVIAVCMGLGSAAVMGLVVKEVIKRVAALLLDLD
jgi:hypothetical protein